MSFGTFPEVDTARQAPRDVGEAPDGVDVGRHAGVSAGVRDGGARRFEQGVGAPL